MLNHADYKVLEKNGIVNAYKNEQFFEIGIILISFIQKTFLLILEILFSAVYKLEKLDNAKCLILRYSFFSFMIRIAAHALITYNLNNGFFPKHCVDFFYSIVSCEKTILFIYILEAHLPSITENSGVFFQLAFYTSKFLFSIMILFQLVYYLFTRRYSKIENFHLGSNTILTKQNLIYTFLDFFFDLTLIPLLFL